MAKTFRQEDLYENDIYGNLRESLEKTNKVLKKSNDLLVQQHKDLAANVQLLDSSAKDVRDLTKANQDSKKALDSKQKIEKQILATETQLNEVTKEQRIRLAEVKIEQSKANKEAKEAAKVNKNLTTEYQKQSKKLNDLRNEYKNLVLAEGQTSKASKALLKDITKLDKKLKSVDKSVGQSQRNIGNYGEGLNKLKGILGSLGLALGGLAIIRDIFNINKEFEASLSSLSAITGVVGEDFEVFKGQVLDVATETKKSAIEVAKAFEIVGSAKPELLANAEALGEVTKQAILLSQATRLDLEVSARSLTGTMNQFNLGAEEASRVINVLAAGSQAGAAPVDQISESLDKFGTVANSINVSVEESVALIEVLAEKSITGADAGTKLRNVLTTLATIETLPPKALENLEKYGVNTAFVADKTNSLEERLTELSKIQGDVNALTSVFGKENLVAGQTLLQNVDGLKSYTSAVTGTNTATEQAAINQDTLSAVIDQLKAAWEAMVLRFSEGVGVLGGLKTILKFVADNLEVIIKTTLVLIGVFATYRATLAASNTITKVKIALDKIQAKSTKKLTLLQKIFNLVLKANPIGLVVTAVFLLIGALAALFGGIKPLTEAFIEMFTSWDGFKNAIFEIGRFLFGSFIPGLEGALKATKDLTAEQERNNKVNNEALKIGKDLLDQNKEEISDVSVLIDALIDKNTTREEELEIIAKLNKDYPELVGNIDLESASTERLIGLKKELITQILNEAIEREKAEQISKFAAEAIRLEVSKIGVSTKGQEQIQKRIDELLGSIPLIEEIAQTVKDNLEGTVEGLDFSGSFRKENDKIRELEAKRDELSRKLLEAKTDDERAAIQDRIDEVEKALIRENEIRTQILDDALDKEKENNAESSESFSKSEGGKTLTLKEELQKRKLLIKDDSESLIAGDRIKGDKGADFSQFVNSLKDETKALELELRNRGASEEEIRKALDQKELDDLIRKRAFALTLFGENSRRFLDADLELRREIDRRNDEQESAEEEARRKKREAEEKAAKERLDRFKKNFSNLNQLAKDSAKIFLDSIDKKIKAGQDEVQASQTEQQRLEELQQQGVTGAAEALVAEKQREAREKNNIEELEKKKRNLLIVLTGLERANQLIQAGDGNPFKNAGEGLNNFINGLPQFRDGTITTVGDAIGAPHLNTKDDRYLSRLNKGEMVLKEGYVNQLQTAGFRTTADVTRAALLSQNQALYTPMVVSDRNDNAKVVDHLNRVEQAIKDFEPVNIIQQHLDFHKGVEIIRDGNKIIKNTVESKGLKFG